MFFFYLSLGFLISLAHAELPSDFQQKVQDLIDKHLTEKRYVGLSIVIVTPTESLQFHNGSMDINTHKSPNNKTIYEIGSISKTFTRLLFANQTDIQLSDSIDSYLPNYVRAPHQEGTSFTFENLATHTAFYFSIPCTIREGSSSPICFGVDPDPEAENPYQNTTRENLYKYVGEYSHTAEEFGFRKPGLYFSYSNVGIGLMGEILAERKNTTYGELVKKEIFNVLDMKSTYVGNLPSAFSDMAKAYTRKVPTANWHETSLWDLPGIAGAGGIRSNLEDMTKYLKANMGLLPTSLDQTLLKGQSYLEEASNMANSNICKPGEKPEDHLCNLTKNYFYFAWPGSEPGTFLYHAGETGGSQSMIIFNQRKSLGIVILSNSSDRSSHYPNDLSVCLMQMAGEPIVNSDLCSQFK